MRLLLLVTLLLCGCGPKLIALPKPALGADVVLPSKTADRIAFAATDRLHALWVEPVGDDYELRYSSFDGATSTWREPSRVSQSRELLSGGVRGPHLVARSNGALSACWFEGEIARIATSKDGGATWTREFALNGAWRNAATLAFGENGKGKLMAAWVQTVTQGATEPVEVAVISDESTSFKEASAYGAQVCRDCGFSVSTAADGGYLAFRHQANERATSRGESTVVLMRTDRAGRAAALIEREGWKIDDDTKRVRSGPVVSTDGAHAVTAWYSAPRSQVTVMMSTDKGRTFRGWRFPSTGPCSGFAATWSGGVATLVWLEKVSGRETVRSMRLSRGGVSPIVGIVDVSGGEGDAWLGSTTAETYLSLSDASGPRLVRIANENERPDPSK